MNMNAQELANKLAQLDDLENWSSHLIGVESAIKREAFNTAEPMWVKRMLSLGKLLVHPDVAEQLRLQDYKPNDLQKKMIWASVLAIDESVDSKERFYIIKKKLIDRYGRDWWEDVYKRKNSAFAAKDRIKKNLGGLAIPTLVANTHIGATYAQDERDKALRMISK